MNTPPARLFVDIMLLLCGLTLIVFYVVGDASIGALALGVFAATLGGMSLYTQRWRLGA